MNKYLTRMVLGKSLEFESREDGFENWIWVDDVVAATKKVPENYEAVDR